MKKSMLPPSVRHPAWGITELIYRGGVGCTDRSRQYLCLVVMISQVTCNGPIRTQFRYSSFPRTCFVSITALLGK